MGLTPAAHWIAPRPGKGSPSRWPQAMNHDISMCCAIPCAVIQDRDGCRTAGRLTAPRGFGMSVGCMAVSSTDPPHSSGIPPSAIRPPAGSRGLRSLIVSVTCAIPCAAEVMAPPARGGPRPLQLVLSCPSIGNATAFPARVPVRSHGVTTTSAIPCAVTPGDQGRRLGPRLLTPASGFRHVCQRDMSLLRRAPRTHRVGSGNYGRFPEGGEEGAEG
jgi:hypothetical protein